jgi:hypothetical protein
LLSFEVFGGSLSVIYLTLTGGVDQFLFNSSGTFWRETLVAFREVGLDAEYDYLSDEAKHIPEIQRELAENAAKNTKLGEFFKHEDLLGDIKTDKKVSSATGCIGIRKSMHIYSAIFNSLWDVGKKINGFWALVRKFARTLVGSDHPSSRQHPSATTSQVPWRFL